MYLCTRDGQTSPISRTKMIADYYLIKQERFNLGLTQAELAKKASLGLSTVIKAEKGGSISPRSNKAIWDALKME